MATYNKFKDTTIYGNLINDTSGNYIANATFNGNLTVNNMSVSGSFGKPYSLMATGTTITTDKNGYFVTVYLETGNNINLFSANSFSNPSASLTIFNNTGADLSVTSLGGGFLALLGSGLYVLTISHWEVVGLQSDGNNWLITSRTGVKGPIGLVGPQGPAGPAGTFSGTTTDITSTGTITANKLNVSGRILFPYKRFYTGQTITSDYSGYFCLISLTAGNSTITLFNPNTFGNDVNPNANITISNTTGGNLSLTTFGNGFYGMGYSGALTIILKDLQVVTLVSNGFSWIISSLSQDFTNFTTTNLTVTGAITKTGTGITTLSGRTNLDSLYCNEFLRREVVVDSNGFQILNSQSNSICYLTNISILYLCDSNIPTGYSITFYNGTSRINYTGNSISLRSYYPVRNQGVYWPSTSFLTSSNYAILIMPEPTPPAPTPPPPPPTPTYDIFYAFDLPANRSITLQWFNYTMSYVVTNYF